MIKGIGIDIVEISRMKKALQNHSHEFAKKILHENEMEIFIHTENKALMLSKFFALKEAFVKAVGKGMRSPFHLTDIQITSLDGFQLHASHAIKNFLQIKNIKTIQIDVTNTLQYVIAFVILQ